MKFLLSIILISTLFSCNSQNKEEIKSEQSENNWLAADLVVKWENNKSYILKMLEVMPEEHYEFVPAEGMRTYKEQAEHIVSSFNYQMAKTGFFDLPEVDNTDKKSLIQSYTKIFDEIISKLKNIKNSALKTETSMWYGQSTYLRILNLADNHLAHHRGQMIVYLRLKGIEPPSYIGW
jgi:uncharacterized damage-inducible protein DinB